MRRIGLHTSTAGALENAAIEAVRVGANCLQIFSSSPRTWRAGTPDPVRVEKMRELRIRHDLYPLVIHTNYLINLAASSHDLLKQSIESFRGELDRAARIGAEYLVLHPGNGKGHPTVDSALDTVAAAVSVAARGLETSGVRLLFENTAGSGNALGQKFAELRALRDRALRLTRLPMGYCVDTCHSLAAGYDIATPGGVVSWVKEMETELGLDNVPVIHSNDSKGALGSHVDRHANIGFGQIGEAGFHAILTHKKLRDKAFILETPFDEKGSDERDIEALKRLSKARPKP
jgi:deoxyribonuclease IV